MKKSLSIWLLCDEYYISASRAQKKKKRKEMTSIPTMDDSALTPTTTSANKRRVRRGLSVPNCFG